MFSVSCPLPHADCSPGAARRHPGKPNRRAASAPRNPQKTQRVHWGGDECLPQAVDAVCRAHTNTGRVHKHREHAGVIVYEIHLYRRMRTHYFCAHTNIIKWLLHTSAGWHWNKPDVPPLTEEVNTPTEVEILRHAHAQFCMFVRNIAFIWRTQSSDVYNYCCFTYVRPSYV